MIGPVSGTGRAMMASLEQAIKKGMPPEQAVQYVKSMATQGVAPLADLYSMMNQFQRLKQQQARPPQTPPTIRDQLNMMDQQQQMAMSRGLGGMDAGSMENPSFAGGGIVAFQEGGTLSSMFDTAKDFGSAYLTAVQNPFGGIAPDETSKALSKSPQFSNEDILIELRTALLKGDEARADQLRGAYLERNRKNLMTAQKDIRLVSERVKDEKTSQDVTNLMRPKPPTPPAPTSKPDSGVSLGTPKTDFSQARNILGDLRTGLETEAGKTAEQRIAEMEALQQRYGIGEAAKKRGEYLTKREAEAEQDLAKDKRMALAQAGFAMAEAASRRGRERTGFLGAAAIGGTTGTKLYQAAVKENRAIKDKIAENRFALDQANEMIKAGNIEKGTALAREAQANLRALDQARAQTELAISEFQGREAGQDRRLAAQLASQDKRYAQAAQIQREKLMSSILEQAPMLITGFEKMSLDEKSKALQALLGSLAGGSSAMTGLGTIEGIEE